MGYLNYGSPSRKESEAQASYGVMVQTSGMFSHPYLFATAYTTCPECKLADGSDAKHATAEEPAGLYFNEVTGIGNMADHYRIVELEARIALISALPEKETKKWTDSYEDGCVDGWNNFRYELQVINGDT